MITNKVHRTISENDLIHNGEHIIVGLSGGPDSVCLFHLLCKMQKQLDLSMHAVHVNHLFRPGDAEEDQKYVEALCARLNIPCHVFVYDCSVIAKEQGISSEEAGRNARYEAFYKVATEIKQKNRNSSEPKVKIAVAHNANDQAETVLIRLLRGTGTDGLAGMEYKRMGDNKIEIIRPLLDIERSQIEEYCQMHDLNPRIDLTNLEPIYTRNKVRLELIPFIEENFHGNITESLIRLSKIAREDKNYIWNNVQVALQDARLSVGHLDCEALQNMDDAIRHRVILKAFEEIGLTQDITKAHMDAVDKLIFNNKTSSSIDLPNRYTCSISYGVLVLAQKTIDDNDSEPGHIFTITQTRFTRGEWMQKEYATDKADKVIGWVSFDYDQLQDKPKPVVRGRKQGDWIRPYGMDGKKKIQDLLVDQKVLQEKRDHIPLVATGSEILWVIGDDISDRNTGLLKGKISGNYLVSEETTNILLLELQHIL